MILTPEQIESAGCVPADRVAQIAQQAALYETLTAYADIVQRVAEIPESVLLTDDGVCPLCRATIAAGFLPWWDHDKKCPWIMSRKARGYEPDF